MKIIGTKRMTQVWPAGRRLNEHAWFREVINSSQETDEINLEQKKQNFE